MEYAWFNIWAPVVVSSVLSATSALTVYKIEKIRERWFELYKTSLRSICLLLDKEITKENLEKILIIKDEMPQKYLNNKTKKNLLTIISKYESLLNQRSYFANHAKLVVEAYCHQLKRSELQLDEFIEKGSYKKECLEYVTNFFEKNPFLFAKTQKDAVANAIFLCFNFYPTLGLKLNEEFTNKCYNEYIRLQRTGENYFEAILENVQSIKYIQYVQNLFEDFKRECECYY